MLYVLKNLMFGVLLVQLSLVECIKAAQDAPQEKEKQISASEADWKLVKKTIEGLDQPQKLAEEPTNYRIVDVDAKGSASSSSSSASSSSSSLVSSSSSTSELSQRKVKVVLTKGLMNIWNLHIEEAPPSPRGSLRDMITDYFKNSTTDESNSSSLSNSGSSSSSSSSSNSSSSSSLSDFDENNFDQKNLDIDFKDKDGNTLLHKAAEQGNCEFVVRLIQKGHPYNPLNKEGNTPRSLAETENKKLVQQFLEKHYNLFENCCIGNLDKVKAALAPGNMIYVNVRDRDGCNPLHYAVCLKQEAIVQFLLEKGARITIDLYNSTPLHWAAQLGLESIVKLLLAAGGRDFLGVKDVSGGNTPLHLAAHFGQRAVVELLLAAGADEIITNNDGETAADCGWDIVSYQT